MCDNCYLRPYRSNVRRLLFATIYIKCATTGICDHIDEMSDLSKYLYFCGDGMLGDFS